MKFFFADSMDLVDPSFDFETETRSETRVRQRDDVYPHEVFAQPPYDGMLVSHAVVQGTGGKSAKYTIAQRQRFLRLGVREFLRLDNSSAQTPLMSMGDCGAFAYVNEERPPVSVEETVEFYGNAGFDYGASVDHVILAYRPELDAGLPGVDAVPPTTHCARSSLWNLPPSSSSVTRGPVPPSSLSVLHKGGVRDHTRMPSSAFSPWGIASSPWAGWCL